MHYAIVALLIVAPVRADEFESIFNGKDLTGWKGDPALWSVAGGAITGKTDGKLPHNSFLIWDGTAGDFELRFKFRIEGGNSGVQYRSKVFRDVGPFAVGGYQADIDSEGRYTGILYEERGRGILAERGQKVDIGPDGGRKSTPIGDAKALLAGVDQSKWNDYAITAIGESLKHAINGKTMIDVIDRQTGKRAADGIIALQLHVGQPMTVQFKDLRIKRLKPQPKLGKVPAGFVAPNAPPAWIWAGPGGERQQAFLRKTFEIKSTVGTARLTVSGDDAATVYIDGHEVLKSTDWSQPEFKDVSGLFLAGNSNGVGRHVIAVRAKNDHSACGVLVRLAFESSQVEPFAIVSDGSWKAANKAPTGFEQPGFDDSAWTSATAIAPVGNKPWDRVTEQTLATTARMRDPSATPPGKLKVAKDFRVELLYSVPKDSQGSWVNLCSDPKGRLYVSDQYGPLYRITPPPLGGRPEQTRIERVPAPIGEAQGLLWAFDSLYVVVNRGDRYESGLYRVRDTDGDDRLDEVTLLRKLDGGGEHGPHAVLLAPGGKSLTIICGNQTQLTRLSGSRVPLHWGEDHLLPRMPDGRGFMAGVLGPGGCIYNVDPDGRNWELISTGYRNEFDGGYNRNGDLFTYDADMEWDFNTPWYRPTRVCLVASGSDYGWRNGAGKRPPYYPDTIPAVLDIGPGSPTGTCFGYGAKFPAKYQDAFFICDWTYGKLYAVHLTPHQSGYAGTAEEFVTGGPLPLTDVIVNPLDGAMYFTIGGRKTKSGLYRVTYAGRESTVPSAGGDDAGSADRRLRKRLEAFHGHPDPKAIAAAWPYLGHSDRLIRSAARIALEHNDPRGWRAKALAETDPAAAIAALLALVRVSSVDPFHVPKEQLPPRPPDEQLKNEVIAALGRIGWESLSEWQRLDLLRVYQILFNRMGKPDAEHRSHVLAALDPIYPAKSRFANAMLCELLVFLESPTVVPKTLALLAAAPTQEEQMEYAKSLRMLRVGWTPAQRREYFTWFARAGAYKGGMSFGGFLGNIKKDAVATLTPTERESLRSILEAKPQTTPVAVQPPRPFVKKWAVRDLDSALASGLKHRDFDRGRTLFGAANCFACHRFANEGGAQGPDLTIVNGRFSPRDLLESIIEPNKEISDQYESVILNTIDGKTITGRIVNHSGNAVTIMPNMLDPSATVDVDRRRIESQDVSKVSMMPEGLLDTMTESEILDLMAYLLSRGERQNGMFRK